MKTTLPVLIKQKPVDSWKVLFSKAFKVVEGKDYNKVGSEMRDNAEEAPACFYEIICTEDRPWEYFKERILPFFVRHLKYKSLDPESGQGVIVSLYHLGRFYLIRGPDFIGGFCEVEGIDRSTYHSYVLQWLSEAGL